jgi:glycosyltransferase involved in cell wall biosynthesis
MPRIAVVSSHPPFTEGGHLAIARSLVSALGDAGHEAELVLTPQNRFGRQGAAYLATWLTDVGESDGRRIDQVISLRFPAYAVRHPHHVCWLVHTMREYYDQWPAFRARLSRANQLKEGVRRRLVRAADQHLLGPGRLRRLFAISATVQQRLQGHLGRRADVLYPPPPQRPYRCDGYGDYVLGVSRLTPLKRVDLLVRALAEPVARAVKAVVAGDGPEAANLGALAAQLGVSDRVAFIGAVGEAALLEHYARCRAVCFTPLDEDYGFVTVEAFASGKPVVSCHDSGGPAELIANDRNGLLCAPEPAAVAGALARLCEDGPLAERLGAEGRRLTDAMRWSDVVRQLVVV